MIPWMERGRGGDRLTDRARDERDASDASFASRSVIRERRDI